MQYWNGDDGRNVVHRPHDPREECMPRTITHGRCCQVPSVDLFRLIPFVNGIADSGDIEEFVFDRRHLFVWALQSQKHKIGIASAPKPLRVPNPLDMRVWGWH